MTLAQDGTGGTYDLRVDANPKWTSVCTAMMMIDTNTTPNVMSFEVRTNDQMSLTYPATTFDSRAGTQIVTLQPPWTFRDTRWSISGNNVDTFALTFRAVLWNFAIDAFQVMPIWILNRSLQQGNAGFINQPA